MPVFSIFISRNLPSLHDEDFTLFDVGSAMGHFLSHFKNSGIHQIIGLDPNPAARYLAAKHYGIDVRTGSIDHFEHEQVFSLITLCGVLEHLYDLHTTVSRIDALLETGGHVFIAVPDAGSFGQQPPTEPFLEFAAEHIDFFTRETLSELFRRHGFEMVACETPATTTSTKQPLPACTIFVALLISLQRPPTTPRGGSAYRVISSNPRPCWHKRKLKSRNWLLGKYPS